MALKTSKWRAGSRAFLSVKLRYLDTISSALLCVITPNAAIAFCFSLILVCPSMSFSSICACLTGGRLTLLIFANATRLNVDRLSDKARETASAKYLLFISSSACNASCLAYLLDALFFRIENISSSPFWYFNRPAAFIIAAPKGWYASFFKDFKMGSKARWASSSLWLCLIWGL